MSSIHGLGGAGGVKNHGVDNTQELDHPKNVDKLGKTAPPPGATNSDVQVPGLSLRGVTTGVAYSQPSPLDPRNLSLPGSFTDSTNVDITACLVLLMQSAMQMRRDQREQWVAQSQTALATSINSADLQIQAAEKKLVADLVTTSVQMGVSVANCAVSLGSAAASAKSSSSIAKQADAIYGPDTKAGGAAADADTDVDVDTQAKSIIGKEGLTGSSIGGESVELDDIGATQTQKTVEKTKEADIKDRKVDAAETHAADNKADTKAAENKTNEADLARMKAKKEFIAQSEYSANFKLEQRTKALTAAFEFGGGIGKMVGTGLTYESELLQAEASKQKALADFQNTQANEQLDFANELRDYANAILSTIKNIESARHAASNSIANI